MKRYLVVYVVNNNFNGSSHFYSKIVCADTIGDAIMQVQNDSRQVINVIQLGSLD